MRRSTSANVSTPFSSTIALRSGYLIAEAVYAAAGVGPHWCSAITERTALSGRTTWIMPVPSSVRATSSLCFASRAFISRGPYPITGAS